ncbi:MAG: transposase [Fervidobacterium sp.]
MLNNSINLSDKLEINKLNTPEELVINLGNGYIEGLSRSINKALKIETMEGVGIKIYRIICVKGAKLKVRKIGKLKVLLALGEDYEGRRELIDYMISEREDELSYEKFLDNLRQKGFENTRDIVHNSHLGLQSTI